MDYCTYADCAAGTYNDRVKATAQSDCKACPPGQYWTGGNSAPNGNWNAGYYWRASSTSATPSGSATNFGVCPAGYYCPAGTGDPIQWPPGTFNPNIIKYRSVKYKLKKKTNIIDYTKIKAFS